MGIPQVELHMYIETPHIGGGVLNQFPFFYWFYPLWRIIEALFIFPFDTCPRILAVVRPVKYNLIQRIYLMRLEKQKCFH